MSFISRVLDVIVYRVRALIQTQFVSRIDMRVKERKPQTQFSIAPHLFSGKFLI